LENCEEPVKDTADIQTATDLAVNAMKAVHNMNYKNHKDCKTLCSGSSDDNGYTALGIKYSMTLELRDQGSSGFILPPSQIIAQGEELVVGMTALWNYAALHPFKK
jgi:extracellular matrix protein 14